MLFRMRIDITFANDIFACICALDREICSGIKSYEAVCNQIFIKVLLDINSSESVPVHFLSIFIFYVIYIITIINIL